MKAMFRTDASCFTRKFGMKEHEGRVETYHLLDTYMDVGVPRVATWLEGKEHMGDKKASEKIKHGVKQDGEFFLPLNLSSDAELLKRAKKLPGLWSKDGSLNAVCVPFCLKEFANAVEAMGDCPSTVHGLLEVARMALTNKGWKHLHETSPSKEAIGSVLQLVPEMGDKHVPENPEEMLEAVQVAEDKTVKELRAMLDAAGVE